MAAKCIVQRNIVSLLLLALLAACATHTARISPTQEAVKYQEVAKNNYTPPGPPSDPWGPYIVEASARFDVPERWIRRVMQMESGGNEYINGHLTTSRTGAMGLMQVEPGTYDSLRAQYHLGGDAYDPHDNILAGTAYLRQLYDMYGTPGFLAAYNAGPNRLAEYLAGQTNLPDETRHYVAVIGSGLGGDLPRNRSPNDELAYNFIPVNIPSGRRRRGAVMMLASNGDGAPPPVQGRSVVGGVARSELAPPVPPMPPRASQPRYAAVTHRGGGLGFVSNAYADTLAPSEQRGGSANWSIQVGAFANPLLARAATVAARQQAPSHLAHALTVIGSVEHGSRTVYRARLAGLTREAAQNACDRLARTHNSCMVVSPDSDS